MDDPHLDIFVPAAQLPGTAGSTVDGGQGPLPPVPACLAMGTGKSEGRDAPEEG